MNYSVGWEINNVTMYSGGYSTSGFSSALHTTSYMNTNEEQVAIGGVNFHGSLQGPNTSEAEDNNRCRHHNFLTTYDNSPAVGDGVADSRIIKRECFENNSDGYDVPVPQSSLLPPPVEEPTIKKPVKKFQCTYCNKLFAKKQQLQNHLKTHTKEKNFKCETCLKGFIHKQQLKNHEKTHSGNKDFKCSFCDKRFMLKQQLQIHEKIHTGERNFGCSMCEKAFITKQQLQNHVNSHLGIKPFACSECHKKFSHKQQLERHMKNHALKQNYNCTACGGKFLTKTAYNEHDKQMHSRQLRRWNDEAISHHSELFDNSPC